jgi:hypothetical protein
MSVDLGRPPPRSGLRLPPGIVYVVLWGTATAVAVIAAILLYPGIAGQTLAVILAVVIFGISVFWVRGVLFIGTPSLDEASAPVFPGFLNDPDLVRPADREERSARRRLRRGTITRREYEGIMARRRFVHGEISRLEYLQLLDQLREGDPLSQSRASPSAGKP